MSRLKVSTITFDITTRVACEDTTFRVSKRCQNTNLNFYAAKIPLFARENTTFHVKSTFRVRSQRVSPCRLNVSTIMFDITTHVACDNATVRVTHISRKHRFSRQELVSRTSPPVPPANHTVEYQSEKRLEQSKKRLE